MTPVEFETLRQARIESHARRIESEMEDGLICSRPDEYLARKKARDAKERKLYNRKRRKNFCGH